MNETTNNTKDQILDVAQGLIQRQGLNAMSFQDLSDAVGIRKASVHYHFPSKDAMVSALLKRYLVDFDCAVQPILRSRSSGKNQLKRYCGLFVETLQTGNGEKGCLCGMLIAEMFSLDDEGTQLVRRFLRENLDYVREMIRVGVDDGSLTDTGDINSAAELVLATLEGGLLLARCEGGPKRLSTIIQRLLALLSTP